MRSKCSAPPHVNYPRTPSHFIIPLICESLLCNEGLQHGVLCCCEIITKCVFYLRLAGCHTRVCGLYYEDEHDHDTEWSRVNITGNTTQYYYYCHPPSPHYSLTFSTTTTSTIIIVMNKIMMINNLFAKLGEFGACSGRQVKDLNSRQYNNNLSTYILLQLCT